MKEMKVVVVGSLGCGKTSLVRRYVYSDFVPISWTLGAAHTNKKVIVEGEEISMLIWDTCGQERFRSQMRLYVRNARVAIICYDISDRNSWPDVEYWIDEVKKTEEGCLLYLCGCKKDSPTKQVDYKTASQFAEGLCIPVVETSSKTGENVDFLFQTICDDFFEISTMENFKKEHNDCIKLGENSDVKKKKWWLCTI